MNNLVGWLIALALVGRASAGDVRLSIPDTTGLRGSWINLPVQVDASLTGRNVFAFQIEVLFSAYILECDTIILGGTLTSAAGMTVTFNRPGPDRVAIAAAGQSSLAGTGPLVYIRFRMKQSGYSSVVFTDAAHNVLNEGDPAVVLKNGYVNVSEPPSINVQPNSDVIAVGEVRTFTVYGGTPPYTWTSTQPGVASLDTLGNLTGISRGFVRVVAHDAGGLTDTTDGSIEVRAMKVSVSDTVVYVGTTFDLPVRVTTLNGLGITSGRISLTFNGDVIQPVSVSVSGGLLDGYGSASSNTAVKGRVDFAFAGSSPISGAGILVTVRFSSLVQGYTEVSFAQALFNEDFPAKVDNASVGVNAHSSIYINPQYADMIAGDVVQFNASNGISPYIWSTSDSLVASVDQDGRVTALKSGNVTVLVEDAVGAKGTTYVLSVYDARVSVPHAFVNAGGEVSVPVRIDRMGAGHSVVAYQLRVTFDSSVVRYAGFESSSSLTAGWSTMDHDAGNAVTLASASTGGFGSAGPLVYLRFVGRASGSLGTYSALVIAQIMLNEGIPHAFSVNGSLSLGLVPQTPVQYSPSDGSDLVSSTPTLLWSTEQYAEHYHLQVSEDSAMTALVVDDSTATDGHLQIGPLSSLTLYFWRVRAVNLIGASSWSGVFRFTTAVTAPSAPELWLPENYATNVSTEASLTWKSVATATSYRLQVAYDSLFTALAWDNSGLTDTTSTVSGLQVDTVYYWRVSATNDGGESEFSVHRSFRTRGPTSIADGGENVPASFGLAQNYPNPFNPTTRIDFTLPQAEFVTVKVFNILGTEVATLVHERLGQGAHHLTWDATRNPSGVYVYRMQAGSFSQTRRMILVK